MILTYRKRNSLSYWSCFPWKNKGGKTRSYFKLSAAGSIFPSLKVETKGEKSRSNDWLTLHQILPYLALISSFTLAGIRLELHVLIAYDFPGRTEIGREGRGDCNLEGQIISPHSSIYGSLLSHKKKKTRGVKPGFQLYELIPRKMVNWGTNFTRSWSGPLRTLGHNY